MFDFTAYQCRAVLTATYSRRMRFAYLVPGVADEVFECLQTAPGSAEEIKELGDACWMAVMLRYESRLPLQIAPFVGGCHLRDHLEAPAEQLIHRWVKLAWARNGVPNAADKACFDAATGRILQLVMWIAGQRGIAIADLLEANLGKLADRAARGVLIGEGER